MSFASSFFLFLWFMLLSLLPQKKIVHYLMWMRSFVWFLWFASEICCVVGRKAILKNRTFAFVSGRLRKFYSGSGASIHTRHPHDLSKYIVHFIVVPWGFILVKKTKTSSRIALFFIWKLTLQSTQRNPISNASWQEQIYPWVPLMWIID